MKMSEWRAERNRQSHARLLKALPQTFPSPVIMHALNRPFIPPTPRLAVDGFWRAHPLRADRLSRALAACSGAPPGWSWSLETEPAAGVAVSFRLPPAPYRDARFSRGPGHCCVCGQPVYRLGWHRDLWGRGPNGNAEWHACCVIAWRLWNAPSDFVQVLKRRQARRCAQSGARLWKTAEIDHRTPLFQVWKERRDTAWPELLAFWGAPNLQVINRDVHVAKCAREAQYRGQRQAATDVSCEYSQVPHQGARQITADPSE